MITLDGGYGEGGGQILRTALVLSLLTGEPFRIDRIRANRADPGLKPQHAQILTLLQQLADVEVDTTQPGAESLHFRPGRLVSGSYSAAIGTAGSISLVLQTILPVMLFAPGPIELTISGGTDVRGGMSFDFWRYVLLPFLRPYAEQIKLTVVRRGFYPRGGGQVILQVTPWLQQASWQREHQYAPALTIPERGPLEQIRLYSFASRDLRDARVATRQAAACQNQLRQGPVQVEAAHVESLSPGSVITAVAEYQQTRLGVDNLGARGVASERVGSIAAEALQQEMVSEATVDEHTADNLMIWVALFGGFYRFRKRTGHIETNAWTIQQFLPGALHLTETEVGG